MVTCALGRSMKKAGMRVPYDVLSQKCREGWMYVGGGGWNSRELIMSPMVLCGLGGSRLEAEEQAHKAENQSEEGSLRTRHKICSFYAANSVDISSSLCKPRYLLGTDTVMFLCNSLLDCW